MSRGIYFSFKTYYIATILRNKQGIHPVLIYWCFGWFLNFLWFKGLKNILQTRISHPQDPGNQMRSWLRSWLSYSSGSSVQLQLPFFPYLCGIGHGVQQRVLATERKPTKFYSLFFKTYGISIERDRSNSCSTDICHSHVLNTKHYVKMNKYLEIDITEN